LVFPQQADNCLDTMAPTEKRGSNRRK